MSLWDITTQPLPGLTAAPETFANYLQRHRLSCVEAARIATLPASLVWRASHWLPISEMSARTLVNALALATGETFGGFLLTISDSPRPRAIRFPGWTERAGQA
jgi:hypothetical protein